MRRTRGFAMTWALLLVLLVSSLGAVVLERDLTIRRDAETDLEALAALHAAEGGIDAVRSALVADPTWRAGRFRIGRVDVEADARPTDGGWRVSVRARPGNARLEASLERRGETLAVAAWRELP